MTYLELIAKLQEKGFTRIERDDRILDILPKETREKGVEMWERNTEDTVEIVRVRLPYAMKTLSFYAIPIATLEQWLRDNQVLELDEQYMTVRGEETIPYLM